MITGAQDRLLGALAAAAVVVFALQVASDNRADVDLWGNVGFVTALPWHVGFHRVNTFSFTEPEHRWINHEWLSEYLLNRTWNFGGDTGLLLLKLMLAGATLLLINGALRADCRSGPVRFFLSLLIVSTMGYGFGIRPHLFTFLLVAATLALLRSAQRGRPERLLLLPPLGLLWCNLHGAFFIGALILAAFLVLVLCSARTRADALPLAGFAAVALALFCLVSLATPFGTRLWRFIVESAGLPRRYLSEWDLFHPLRDFTDHVDFLALAAVTAGALLLSRRRRELPMLGLLALAFLAAIVLRRNIPLFAMTVGFCAGEHFDSAYGARLDALARRLPRPALAAGLAVFVALSAGFTVRFHKTAPLHVEIPAERFPVRAVAFLNANRISGNALVFFDWAEYCIWHGYPRVRVFLDGRFSDAYSPATIADYFGFLYRGPTWARALDAYATDIVLIHPRNPVCADMRRRADWRLVYEDAMACLFLKVSTHAADLAAANEWIQPEVAPQDFLFP